MECRDCGEAVMKERKASKAQPYQYAESGLDNIFLIDVRVWRCPKCKEEVAEIPKIGKLNRLILKDLLEKPTRLTGKEIRFMRKEVGLPAKKFAALMRVTPFHLSRIENEATKQFGESTDTLARLWVLCTVQAGQKAIMDYAANLMVAKAGTKRKKPTFRLVKNEWKEAA